MPTVREQLASVWNYISGAGTLVEAHEITVWRDGRLHRFSTFVPIDEVEFFRLGEGIWLYAIQASVLTYKGETWHLYKGWNNIGWLVDEMIMPPTRIITDAMFRDPVPLHRDLVDVRTPHVPTDLVPAIATEAEVGGRISEHAELPNIHHFRSHDHSLAADGTPLAMDAIPPGPSGQVITGQGVEVVPVWSFPPLGRVEILTALPPATAEEAGRVVRVRDANVLETKIFACVQNSLGDWEWVQIAVSTGDYVMIGVPTGESTHWRWALPDFPRVLGLAETHWVIPGWYASKRISATVSAGRIYYAPIFVDAPAQYTRIGIHVVTGSVGIADLRIFNWDHGMPGSLILAAGTVSTSTPGIKLIEIHLELNRGYYFLASRFTGNPACYVPDPFSAVSPAVSGFNVVGLGHPWMITLRVDADFADPAPGPTDGEGTIGASVMLGNPALGEFL